MKVLNVIYEVMPTVKQVTCKQDYDKVQLFLYNVHGFILPPWDELDIQFKGNMVVFIENWVCKVRVLQGKKIYELTYKFSPGFISDKGSVPKLLRSIVDNDDPQFLVAFYIHDANYKCHFLNRDQSDDLLRAMGKFAGAGIFKRNAVYQSVNLFGGSAYKSGIKSINEQRKYVTYAILKG